MNKTKFIVRVRYSGEDGYGFGIKRKTTRRYNFDSIEEAKAFVPSPIGVVGGHGVTDTLEPTYKDILKEELIRTEISHEEVHWHPVQDYVIINKDGEILRRQADESIVVYGSYEAAMEDFKEGDSIIPLHEYGRSL